MNERHRPRDSNEIRRNLAPTFAAASGAPSAATSGNMGEANPISGRNASAQRQGITNADNTRTHSTGLNATAYAYVQHAKDVAMEMREKQQKQAEMNRHAEGVSATQSSALVGAGTGVGAQLALGLQHAAMHSAELVPTATGKQQQDTLRTAVRPPTLGTMSHQLRPQVIQHSQQALSHQPQAQVQAQTQSHAPGHIQTHALYTKTRTFEKPQQSFGALLEGMKKLKQTHVESECKLAQQNETIGEYEVKMKEQNSRLQELQKRCGHLERKLQVELKSRDEVLRKIQSINTLCLSLKEKMSNIDEVIAKGEEDKDDIKRELKRDRVAFETLSKDFAELSQSREKESAAFKVMVESLHKRLADLTTQLEKSREFVATLEMEVSDREADLVKMREDAFADGEQRRVLEQEKSAIEYDLSQQKALVASLKTQMSLKGTELEQMQLMLSEKDRTVAITSENMREQTILLQTNAKGMASLQSEYDLLTQKHTEVTTELQRQLVTVEDRIKVVTSEKSALENRITELIEESAKHAEVNAQLNNNIINIEQKLELAMQAKEETEGTLNAFREEQRVAVEQLNSQIAECTTKLSALEVENMAVQAERSELQGWKETQLLSTADAATELLSLGQKYAMLKADNTRLLADNAQLNETVTTDQQKLHKLEHASEQHLKALNLRLEAMTIVVQHGTRQQQDLTHEFAEEHGTVATLRAQQVEHQATVSGLEAALADAQQELEYVHSCHQDAELALIVMREEKQSVQIDLANISNARESLLAEKTTREELLVTYNQTNKAQQGIIQQKDTRINDLEHQQMALEAKCRDGNLRAESTAFELSNMRICVAEAEREIKAAVALRDKLQQQSLAQESMIETLRDQLRHAHSQDTDWNAGVRDSGLTSREENPDSEDMDLDVPGETLTIETDAVVIDNPPRDTFTVDQPTATELNITKNIHSPKAPTRVPATATTTASDVLPKRKARTKPKGNVRSRSKSADTALHPLPDITGDSGKKSEASVGQKSSKGTKTATTSRPRRRSAAVQRHMITSLSEDSTSPVPPVQVKTKTAAVKGKTFRKTPRKPKGPSKTSVKPKAKAKKDVQDKAKAADDNHGNGDSAMSDSSAAEILDDKENQAPEGDWAIQFPSGGNRPPLAKSKTTSSETRQPGTPEVMPFRDITATTNNPPKPSRTGFRGKKSQAENTVQATVESPLDFLCDDAWGFNDD